MRSSTTPPLMPSSLLGEGNRVCTWQGGGGCRDGVGRGGVSGAGQEGKAWQGAVEAQARSARTRSPQGSQPVLPHTHRTTPYRTALHPPTFMTVPSLDSAVRLVLGLPYTCRICHPSSSPPPAPSSPATRTLSARSNTRGLHKQPGQATGPGQVGTGQAARQAAKPPPTWHHQPQWQRRQRRQRSRQASLPSWAPLRLAPQ